MSEAQESAAGREDQDKPPVEVRPTVFVALGGTGMEVLLRLRRRILQSDWNGSRINNLSEFPVASFLYFDTDTNEARETGRASGDDPMAEAVVFGKGDILQSKVDVGYYQANKRSHPVIDEWLPARDLSRIDTEKGAGQIRCISRLLFFHEFNQFRAAMAEKGRSVIANVSRAGDLERLGLKTQRTLRVVVVGSVAGGTGSGAFIDAGLAIRSMVDPQADQVDLFLVLPGGYTGANRDRVFANTYAALSELEHVMRPNPNPPYVKMWTAQETPRAGVTKPYSDIYLFDTRNLNNDATGRITDVFDMVADILFEDFGNSEFARKKRSISVNQQQHKLRMFLPPMSPEFGEGALSFSAGYSAVGQSILATTGSIEFEAAVVDAGRTMLEAFFGVAADRQARVPSPDKRDEFMANNLELRSRTYSDFPGSLRSKPQAIVGYALIDRLLEQADHTLIDQSLVKQVDDDFQKIRESVNDPEAWLRQAKDAVALRERDVQGAAGERAGAKYGLSGDKVYEARQRFSAELRSEGGARSLKSKFYDLLDDQEHAGLDYTIELIQQIKASFRAEGRGVIAQLARAEQELARAAGQIRTEELAESLIRLEQAGKRRMFGAVDRAAAEKCLTQVQDDLKAVLQFSLRAIAAKEARLLLEEIDGYMGDKLPAEDDGEPRWTGLLREFQDGYALVSKTLELIRADANRVRDAVNRPESAGFLVIGGSGKGAFEVDQGAALDWARQAFQDFGGCRVLFGMLKTEGERLKVLNQLRSIAKARLGPLEERIPTVIDVLRTMTPADRRKVLERMLARATPWIHANFDRARPKGDQYKMLIAVNGARAFQDEFGPALLDLMPKHLGMAAPGIEETEVKGRIVCYCELSGIPLDVLAPLRDDWRKSYEKEASGRDPLPLHNHEDALRFPSPIPPSPAELDALQDDLQLFLKGVLFGALERRPGPGQAYQIDMSVNDLQRVGSERTIRRRRFDPAHRRRLEELVGRFESKLGPLQTFAASVLLDWTARRAYAPRLEAKLDQETRLPGITHKVAQGLAQEYLSRFKALRPQPQLGVSLEEAREALLQQVDAWTRVVAGSLDDVEHMEANRDPNDPADMRAEDKRTVDPAHFGEDALRLLINPGAPAATAAADNRPPPPPTPGLTSFYVALDGQTQGPFDFPGLQALAAQGRLGPQSHVFDVLANGPWVIASASPGLVALFRPPPPPPPLAS